MNTPDMEQVKKKASDAAHNVGDELREQWHLVREQAPEFLYPSVSEAAAANARRTEANLAYYRENPSMVSRRMAELDDEWDVQRVLQVVTSGATIGGFWFAITKSRIWLLLSLAMAGGALHHGLTGGSPAADFVRRLGFRTRDEIEFERRALMNLESGHDESLFGNIRREEAKSPSPLTEPQMG